MRVGGGAAVVLALALAGAALAPIPVRAAATSTGCRIGDTAVLPGRTICLDGMTSVCLPRGAWAIDRQTPCTDAGAIQQACRVSTTELAAPGARSCKAGRLRQCSQKGDWIDLAGSC